MGLEKSVQKILAVIFLSLFGKGLEGNEYLLEPDYGGYSKSDKKFYVIPEHSSMKIEMDNDSLFMGLRDGWTWIPINSGEEVDAVSGKTYEVIVKNSGESSERFDINERDSTFYVQMPLLIGGEFNRFWIKKQEGDLKFSSKSYWAEYNIQVYDRDNKKVFDKDFPCSPSWIETTIPCSLDERDFRIEIRTDSEDSSLEFVAGSGNDYSWDYRMGVWYYNGDGETPRLYINRPFLTGDVNRDGKVNILDLIKVRNALNQDVGSGENWKADVNEDGRINVLDLIEVRNNLRR